MKALQTQAVLWHKAESIPKEAVLELIDIVPALIYCSFSYNEVEAMKINHAIDQIAEAIRESFTEI